MLWPRRAGGDSPLLCRAYICFYHRQIFLSTSCSEISGLRRRDVLFQDGSHDFVRAHITNGDYTVIIPRSRQQRNELETNEEFPHTSELLHHKFSGDNRARFFLFFFFTITFLLSFGNSRVVCFREKIPPCGTLVFVLLQYAGTKKKVNDDRQP